MPELPEVELCCQSMERWCAGCRIGSLEILDSRVVSGSLGPESLSGQRVERVWRRAKLGIIELEDSALVFHLRMTGQWLVEGRGARLRRVRARLVITDGPVLLFDDSRCLGRLEICALKELESVLEARGLGPEPWPERRDGAWWKARLHGLRGPIKPALMRQDRVAGLGNIAGSEICFRSGIDPTRKVSSLTETEWAGLAEAAHRYIDSTLEAEDSGDLIYIQHGGVNPFQIYGRCDACVRCGGRVERFVQSGRATWWCSGCQV